MAGISERSLHRFLLGLDLARNRSARRPLTVWQPIAFNRHRMDKAGKDNVAEWAVDVAAALLFAFAAGFAGWALDARPVHAAVVGPAFLLAYAVLRRWPGDERSFALPAFGLAPIAVAAAPAGELLLEADQILAPGRREAELLLDDPLVRTEPGSRVVRLFGADRAPRCSGPSQSRPDASLALSQALADLRRSLR